jgi:hypothetical protein
LPPEKLSKLEQKGLKEVSGIASSINNQKHFWVHNDAGNRAEVYLLDEDMNVKLTCDLAGVENRDWEDIAVGPGPDPSKHYLYVGEIGDNDAEYKNKYVYRFEEPVAGSEKTISITSFDKITFRLEGERKDTETLLLDPKSKNLYVVTKRERPVYVYELKYPYNAEENVASKVTSIPTTEIVSGQYSPDGNEIVLKNYENVFYWRIGAGQSLKETLQSPPLILPYDKEPQGEAITWATDGGGFYTLSEVTKGKDVYLTFYKRNTAR